MQQKWSIREYREGDEERILDLWKAVYPSRQRDRERVMRWWHWNKDNPAGLAKIWLAEHNGKIIGQALFIFMMMKVGNQIVKAHEHLDLMTHPDYRHQGVFSSLQRHAFDEAESEGVHISIAFPNKASYPGHIKSGWFDIDTTQILFKPLHWGNAVKTKISNKFLINFVEIGGNLVNRVLFRAKRPPVVEGLTITQVSHFDERINGFWDSVSSQYQIMMVRNRDFLNWRYVTVPDVDYSIYIAEKREEICGYIVLRCVQQEYRKVGTIYDIVAQSEQIAQCLVSKAVEHCKQEEVDVIFCSLIAKKTRLETSFRRNGFISVPFVKGGLFCAHSSSCHISRDFLKDSNNWFPLIADLDVTYQIFQA